jgi:hypothetical protein
LVAYATLQEATFKFVRPEPFPEYTPPAKFAIFPFENTVNAAAPVLFLNTYPYPKLFEKTVAKSVTIEVPPVTIYALLNTTPPKELLVVAPLEIRPVLLISNARVDPLNN